MAARRPDIETCLLIERVILERNVLRRKSIDVPTYSARAREREGEREREEKRRKRKNSPIISLENIFTILRDFAIVGPEK